MTNSNTFDAAALLARLTVVRAEIAEIVDVYRDSDEQEQSFFDVCLKDLSREEAEIVEALRGQANHTNSTVAQLETVAVILEGRGNIAWEVECARTMARSPLSLGDLVKVSAPFVGLDSGGREQFGRDAATGVIGRVTRFTADGEEIMIFADGRFDDYVPTCRVSRV